MCAEIVALGLSSKSAPSHDAHVIDDQQVGLEVTLQRSFVALKRFVCQEVSDNVEDRTVVNEEAVSDRGQPKSLDEMAFSSSWGTNHQQVPVLMNEATRCQFVDV